MIVNSLKLVLPPLTPPACLVLTFLAGRDLTFFAGFELFFFATIDPSPFGQIMDCIVPGRGLPCFGAIPRRPAPVLCRLSTLSAYGGRFAATRYPTHGGDAWRPSEDRRPRPARGA